LEKYLYQIFSDLSIKLPYIKEIELAFDVPQLTTHGDLSSNAAMLSAKKAKRKPRELAEEIVANLVYSPDVIENIEIAGPGFINFFFKPSYLTSIVKDILELKDSYGKSDRNKGKKANVEFVSANPTGPLTVGHGRNAVLGDTIANLLEWTGYQVEREYYFNNAGRQMRVLGDSVKKRYLNLLGQDIEFPDDYYQGEYIKEIAAKLKSEHGDKLAGEDPEGIFKQSAEKEIFEQIKKTLNRLGIKHNIFFNEKSLYDTKIIDRLLEDFRERDLSYDKEGAVWLKLREMGGEQDKVVVKSTGEPTYRLPDIAYHVDKFQRGYDLMIDIFGSDHTDTYPDVLAGVKALGYDTSKVAVLIHQFVTVMENGEVVKMSTRKANYITVDELIDEVGSNVLRYSLNRRNRNTQLNFDLHWRRNNQMRILYSTCSMLTRGYVLFLK